MKNLVGQTIKDRYFVQEHLGRGGMAEVYKVWDNHRNTVLAMKVLHEDLAVDRVFMRRFRREAETLARLQHPNIVRFYGLEEEGRLAFMLLDYIEGDNLKLKIFDARGPYSTNEIIHVMQGVCQALAFAHKESLIHNDIKPGNIMINQFGQVLLADFGIARLTDAATATMVGAGTPAYMAPEQIKGLNPVPQTDIYALGIVLYEMLTGGERPFTGERATITGTTSARVRWEQINLDPPSPRILNPEVSPALEQVVLKCLGKNPSQRYQSALELLNALESAIGIPKSLEPQPFSAAPVKKPVTPPAPPKPEKAKEAVPTVPWYRQWVFWSGLAVVAALLLGLYFGNANSRTQLSPVSGAVQNTIRVEEAVVGAEDAGEGGEEQTVAPDVATEEPTATITETAVVPTPTLTTVGTQNNPIRLVFIPSVDVNYMQASMKSIEQSLFESTGLYFEASVPWSYAATIEEICAYPENTIGFIPAMGYVLANQLCGAEPALAAVHYGFNIDWTAFFVPRDSPYQTLSDLEGKTWAYPDQTSTSGYLYPAAGFESFNIHLGKELEAGGHPQAVWAVYNGTADVGTAYFSPPLLPSGIWSMNISPDIPDNLVDSCIVNKVGASGQLFCGEYRVLDARAAISLQAPDVVKKVRIMALSPEIPNDTVSFSPDFPEEIKEQMIEGISAYVDSPDCADTICNESFYDWSELAPIYDYNYDGLRLLIESQGITHENIGN